MKKTTILIFIFSGLLSNTSLAQQTDIKQVLRNQINIFRIQQQKERQVKQLYINRMEQKLQELDDLNIKKSTQPLSNDEKTKVANLASGLGTYKQLHINYDVYLQRQEQLQRQIQLEQIQQQSLPIIQQQKQNFQQVASKIQEQQRQQQQVRQLQQMTQNLQQ